MDKNNEWIKSPITNREEVLMHDDPADGVSKMCIGSGFYTNENPLNYKKNPDFDIEKYESKMPTILKELRFDDGESYWYPCTISTATAIVFPAGSKEDWKWCYAEIKDLENQVGDYTRKLDIESAQYFDRFIEASKLINGYSLDELP